MAERNLTARLFWTFLIAIVLSPVAEGQLRKCADFNEYCQNHWDCCSNTCLSYLYRCTQSLAIFPYTFLGRNYAPPQHSTLQEIYDFNFGSVVTRTEVFPLPQVIFGRFGGEDEDYTDEHFNVMKLSSTTTTTTHPAPTTLTTTAAATTSAIETTAMEKTISAAMSMSKELPTTGATTTTTTTVLPLVTTAITTAMVEAREVERGIPKEESVNSTTIKTIVEDSSSSTTKASFERRGSHNSTPSAVVNRPKQTDSAATTVEAMITETTIAEATTTELVPS